MNYEKIKKEIKEFVDERDWDQFHTPKNLSMALSVEASELLEIFQWQKAEEYKNATEEQKEMIKDEIADIFYYLVRISDKLDINIEEALLKKMKKNREKYFFGNSVNEKTKNKLENSPYTISSWITHCCVF